MPGPESGEATWLRQRLTWTTWKRLSTATVLWHSDWTTLSPLHDCLPSASGPELGAFGKQTLFLTGPLRQCANSFLNHRGTEAV